MNTGEKVKRTLEQHAAARDSYEYFLYWYLFDEGLNPLEMTVQHMLKEMKEERIPKWNTLERARRIIQEDNPELRGKTYDVRKQLSFDWDRGEAQQ